ncbi:zf-HC2 domain-containing protein [candidate division KSB1 bacterium]|nr:zf-HC2 domain-containing protein [candidate division KSB1 bacterium]
MSRCKQVEQWMIEARFGELDASRQVKLADHLETCVNCQARSEKFLATMNRIDRYSRPELDNAYWTAYWNKLEARLPAQKSSFTETVRDSLNRMFKPATPAGWTPRLAFGAVIILVMGIFIGRAFFSNPQVIMQPIGNESSNLFIQTSQYVERSKLILLGIVNTDSESDDLFSDNFSRQQSMSRQLVNQSEPLKTALANCRQPMLQELVEELEVILLQIANLEAGGDIQGVDLIRSGAESNSILMKINLGELLLSRPQQKSELIKNIQSI